MGLDVMVQILIFMPGFLLGIVVHEFSHAWMANRLGDPTARMLGRISLNPLRHLELWGTVLLPLFLLVVSHGSMVFGYAKPVLVTRENFRFPRRDSLLVSLAGPGANLLLAVCLILAAWGARQSGWLENPGLRQVLAAALSINVMLAAFNLLPLPPLDGAEIITALLPGRWAYAYSRLTPYSFLILMLLFATGTLRFLMGPISLLIQILLSPLGNPFL